MPSNVAIKRIGSHRHVPSWMLAQDKALMKKDFEKWFTVAYANQKAKRLSITEEDPQDKRIDCQKCVIL